jgi:hypothetical protein
MADHTKFNLGDKVEWTSQAQAFAKTKQGEIVEVVTPGERPNHEKFIALYRGSGCGFGRRHESYVVRVGKKHYWPVVSLLKQV